MEEYSIYITLSFIGIITSAFIKEIIDINDPLLNKFIKKFVNNLQEATNKIDE